MNLGSRELDPKIGAKEDREKREADKRRVDSIDWESPYCPNERGQSKRQQCRQVHIRYLVLACVCDQVGFSERGMSERSEKRGKVPVRARQLYAK